MLIVNSKIKLPAKNMNEAWSLPAPGRPISENIFILKSNTIF